jgi:hypothetical protein
MAPTQAQRHGLSVKLYSFCTETTVGRQHLPEMTELRAPLRPLVPSFAVLGIGCLAEVVQVL